MVIILLVIHCVTVVLTLVSNWLIPKILLDVLLRPSHERSIDTCSKTAFCLLQRHAVICPPESNSHGWVADHVVDVLLTAKLRHFAPQEALSRAAGWQLPKRGHCGQRWTTVKKKGAMGWRRMFVDGWGDGGQPLLSASIRKPRGDMGAGKTEGIKGGGGGGEVRTGSRPLTSHPSALEYTCLLSHTPHHLPPSPLHLFTMQMCNPAAAGTCCSL